MLAHQPIRELRNTDKVRFRYSFFL